MNECAICVCGYVCQFVCIYVRYVNVCERACVHAYLCVFVYVCAAECSIQNTM